MASAIFLVARFRLSFVVVVAAAASMASPAVAQNGSNYHALCNAPDAVLLGVGAGGTQTAQDGMGTYIPGEDLRGSLLVDPDHNGPLPPHFSYRITHFTESLCV